MRQTNRKKENPWKQQIGKMTKKKKRKRASQPVFLSPLFLFRFSQTDQQKVLFFFLKPLLVIITRIRGIADFLLTSLCVCFFFKLSFSLFRPINAPVCSKVCKDDDGAEQNASYAGTILLYKSVGTCRFRAEQKEGECTNENNCINDNKYQ